MTDKKANQKIPVGVLGATGSVGQRFVQLLDNHPWFKLAALTGSERTSGTIYGQTCRWVLSEPMPETVRGMEVLPSDADQLNLPLVFSALPSQVAQEVEPRFAAAGVWVCSNASAFREEYDVPLLLPEINPDHIFLLDIQREQRKWNAGILTNPNCTSAGITVVLKALDQAFGLGKAFVVSMQALSGAGYPGVPSLDILDNVIPFIGGEEEKVEKEPRKMLGKLTEGGIDPAAMTISAHCNRVAVSDGHLACISFELEKKATREECLDVFQTYQPPEVSRGLPSTPEPVMYYRPEENRPQPRYDRMTGEGMTTVIGRLRSDPILDWKLVVLSHNTIRGAAGGSIYNAELLVKNGYLAFG